MGFGEASKENNVLRVFKGFKGYLMGFQEAFNKVITGFVGHWRKFASSDTFKK